MSNLNNSFPELTAKEKIANIFQDKLTLTVCLLLSAVTLVKILENSFILSLALPLIFAAVIWLPVMQSSSGKVDVKYLKWLSGAVFLLFILGFIFAGLLAFCGVSLILVSYSAIKIPLVDYLHTAYPIMENDAVVFSVILIGCAILTAVLVFLSLGTIHKFTKSFYENAEIGIFRAKKANSASIWVFVLGAYYLINVILNILNGHFVSAVSALLTAAAVIVGAFVIRKHFFKQ